MNKLANSFLLIIPLIVCIFLSACDKTQTNKTYTIGIINLSPRQETTVKGYKEGMAQLGYIEGENVTYIYDGATGDIDILNSVAEKLVNSDVDLILSVTTPATQAAKDATEGTDIPVVFANVTDPVGASIVNSLSYPGGNITGVTFGVQEGLRLQWLIQVVPGIENIYIPYNSEDESPLFALEKVSEAAETLGINIIRHETQNPEEVEAAFTNIPDDADAVFFLPDSMITVRIDEWLENTIIRKLPTSGPNLSAVQDGHLTSYGIDLAAAARNEASRLSDQILKGTKPSDLPVETAEFYSAVNLKTAELIGIEISDDILRQTDIIIR